MGRRASRPGSRVNGHEHTPALLLLMPLPSVASSAKDIAMGTAVSGVWGLVVDHTPSDSSPMNPRPPPSLCDIPSGCCFFTGLWTVTLLPFTCCVGSLRYGGRCGLCSSWFCFRVHGAQWLVYQGCAGCGGRHLCVSAPPPVPPPQKPVNNWKGSKGVLVMVCGGGGGRYMKLSEQCRKQQVTDCYVEYPLNSLRRGSADQKDGSLPNARFPTQ